MTDSPQTDPNSGLPVETLDTKIARIDANLLWLVNTVNQLLTATPAGRFLGRKANHD